MNDGSLRTRGLIVVLAGLIAFAFSLALSLLLPPPTYKDDLPGGLYRSDGLFNPNPPNIEFGFYSPERNTEGVSYRWTGAHATLTFPYAANAGRYLHVSLNLAGGIVQGQTPPTVTVVLNGRAEQPVVVAGMFHRFDFSIDTRTTPNPNLDPSHLQVDILSTTSTIPSDRRDLGVAVDWVEVTPQRSTGEILAEAATWLVCLALVTATAIWRFPVRIGLGYGAGALLTMAAIHLLYMPIAFPVAGEVSLGALAWLLAALAAPREEPLWGFALGLLCAWLVLAGHIFQYWRIDDAYISYRYAWNLVQGHGLVYNVGQPVEGYTNFLWTIVAAVALWAGSWPPGVDLLINIACAQVVVALAFVVGRYVWRDKYLWPLLAAALLCVDDSILTYGARGSGMEEISYSLFAIAAFAVLWNPGWQAHVGARVGAGLLLALAALSRPEGLLIAGVLLVVRAWQDRAVGRPYWALLAGAIAPLAVVVLPYEAWRISFYGYPFPNTFYAKTGATFALVARGMDYCLIFLGDHWLIGVLLLLGVALIARGLVKQGARRGFAEWSSGAAEQTLFGLAALAVVYTAYIVVAGGDHFPAGRFFVPLLVPLVILGVRAFQCLYSILRGNSRARRVVLALGGVMAIAFVVFAIVLETPDSLLLTRTRRETASVDIWGSAGLWLRDNTAAQSSTAAEGAGAIAFFSQRPTIDMYGLNDLHIGHLYVPNMGDYVAGHEKQDPQYVLNLRPNYILVDWDVYFAGIRSELESLYKQVTVSAPTGVPTNWWHLRSDTASP